MKKLLFIVFPILLVSIFIVFIHNTKKLNQKSALELLHNKSKRASIIKANSDKFVPIIVVAGETESGSTLLSEFIIEYYKYKHKSVSLCFATKCKMFEDKDIRVIKTHYYIKFLHDNAIFVFSSKRDIRYAIASAIIKASKFGANINNKKFVEELVYDFTREQKILYNSWKKNSNYEFVYEDYLRSPNKILRQVVDILDKLPNGSKTDQGDFDKIVEKINKIKDDKKKINNNNISSIGICGYGKVLKDKHIKYIEQQVPELIYNKCS